MISQKLKIIFLVSIPVFVAHGLEEIFTGLYNVDSHVAFMFGGLAKLPTMEALFILSQIMIWLVLVVSFLLLLGPKWQLRRMIILGLVYIYELHHFWKAFEAWGYYPGLITAIAFAVIGFFFWKELIKNYKLT